MTSSIKNIISNISKVVFLLTIIPSIALLTGCGKSEVELCVDKQSHLWDKTRGATREDNKAYWTAVENCRKKYK